MLQRWEAVRRSAERGALDFSIERVLAFSRLTLVAFTLLAVQFDSTEVVESVRWISIILVGYVTLALIVAVMVVMRSLRPAWHLPIYLVDIGVISVLMYLSSGQSIPFFVFYIFVLFTATVRWNWRGSILTAILLAALLALMMWQATSNASGSINDFIYLNIMLSRLTFLLLAGIILATFWFSREFIHDRLARLSAWPSPAMRISQASGSPLDVMLQHVVTVIQVPRILILWEQLEEPYVDVILYSDGVCTQERRGTVQGEWVAAEIAKTAFASSDVSSGMLFTLSEPRRFSKVAPIDVLLQSQFDIKSTATAPFEGSICRGRVFLLDQLYWREHDLMLAQIIASRVGLELEHHTLRLELERATAIRERARITRDLHDGILQTLTASGLQLRAAADQYRELKGARLLEDVRELLLEEQRRIRTFVESQGDTITEADFGLASEARLIVDTLERLWRCQIKLAVTPTVAHVTQKVARHLDFVLRETVANAMRHGHASCIEITIDKLPTHLLLRISDDGQGLDCVSGYFDHAELVAHNIGPVSVRNRITEAGGSLALASSTAGVKLEITLPL
jgi:signal transduction histidine kinase